MIRILVGLVCTGLLGWMSAATYFSPLDPAWLRTALAGLFPVATLGALFVVRPLARVAQGVLVGFVVVLLAWLSIAPSNDREWQPDVASLAHAEVRGDRLVVHNVRNVDYRTETDFTVHYEDREYDLSKLRSLDIFLIYWGSPLIAHTIMSWGFEDGEQIAISIETRKEVGESYSAVRGFFRQYELVYVVADERDVIRLRTNYRGEHVYLYRLAVPEQGPRLLLMRYLDAVNKLYEEAEWYNALTHNCTTTIQQLAGPLEQRSWWSWKLLANGFFDEHAYEIGALDQSLPFDELKKRSHIDAVAKKANQDPLFSQRIREGLPGMTRKSGS